MYPSSHNLKFDVRDSDTPSYSLVKVHGVLPTVLSHILAGIATYISKQIEQRIGFDSDRIASIQILCFELMPCCHIKPRLSMFLVLSGPIAGIV